MTTSNTIEGPRFGHCDRTLRYAALRLGHKVYRGFEDALESGTVVAIFNDEKCGRLVVVRIFRKHKGWYKHEVLRRVSFSTLLWRFSDERNLTPQEMEQ